MDTLKAKGPFYNSVKSKLIAKTYKNNSNQRRINLDKINSEILRISEILGTPIMQKKAFAQKLLDLKTFKRLIKEQVPEEEKEAEEAIRKKAEEDLEKKTATSKKAKELKNEKLKKLKNAENDEFAKKRNAEMERIKEDALKKFEERRKQETIRRESERQEAEERREAGRQEIERQKAIRQEAEKQEATRREKIRNALTKGKNPPKVVLGHSYDVCIGDKLQELIVPPNCFYITFTQCGLVGYVQDSQTKKFFDPANKEFLEHPDIYEDELKKIFGKHIHIHKPGDTYVNTKYYPLSFFPSVKRFSLSGVVPIDGTSKFIESVNYNSTTPNEDIENLFKYSIFPLKKDIAVEMDKQEKKGLPKEYIYDSLNDSVPKISQKKLFDDSPGVYYNPLCRVSNNRCSKNITRRRRNSLAHAKRIISEVDMESYIEYYDDYIKKIVYNCKTKNECSALEELDLQLSNTTPIGLHLINDLLSISKYDDIPLISKMKIHIEEIMTSYLFSLTFNIYKLISQFKPAEILKIMKENPEEEKNLRHFTNIQIDRHIFNLKKLLNGVNPNKIHMTGATTKSPLLKDIYTKIELVIAYGSNISPYIKYYLDRILENIKSAPEKERDELISLATSKIEEYIEKFEELRKTLNVKEGGRRRSRKLRRYF